MAVKHLLYIQILFKISEQLFTSFGGYFQEYNKSKRNSADFVH